MNLWFPVSRCFYVLNASKGVVLKTSRVKMSKLIFSGDATKKKIMPLESFSWIFHVPDSLHIMGVVKFLLQYLLSRVINFNVNINILQVLCQ